MCRIDDCDDRVEIFQSGDRRARKEYHCTECGRPIAAGETYHYEFGKLVGDSCTFRTCAHCMVARNWLSKNCGGWVYEQVIEEVREHGDEYPKLAMPLLRIAVGARRKWRGFHGQIMPIPATPPSIASTLGA